MSGNLLHLLFQPLSSVEDGRTTDSQSATAIGAAPLRRRIGITVHNQDTLNRDGELLGDDLGKRGLFALAVRGRTGIDHHGAALLDTHARTLVEADRRGSLRAKAANLNIGGDADTHQLALGALLGLFRAQALVIRQRQSLV